MWWKALLAAFGLLFVAELGDKTQLAVTVGTALYEFLPEKVVRYGVAGLFLLFGVLTLLRRDEEEGRKAEGRNPFLSVFLIIALMELGDKTQLSLLALAARYSYPVFVFLGGTLALCLTSLVGALVGTSLSRLVSPPWMRRISGIVFLAFGAASLFW